VTDEPRKPPRFPLPPRDEDVVEIPPTLRTGRPPAPREPFRNLAQEQKAEERKTIGEVLTIQRKMSLQLDGFGQVINRRFELFHQELALQSADGAATRQTVEKLHALVTGDHGPRLEAVEQKTSAQKAKAAAVITARFGAWGSLALLAGGFALRALAKLYPQYGELIEGLTGLVGL
jgi:hypothetical protein